ncbi:MAG: ferrous iron transporter B, partial [Bacteroidales bacterium]|nr:ferrous iron transporter B [Bacteroidales bacterium]
VLGYFPRNVNYSSNFDERIAAIEESTTIPVAEKEAQIYELELEKIAEHQEKSYIGQIGHFIEPAIRPLGFDWKIGISLITGLAAKEIVVSSMGILYQADLDADENSSSLVEKLQQQVHTSGKLIGQKVFTPLVAYGFMLFVLIYFPCIASIASIRKEANGKWARFTMVYTTALAWIVSFAVYNIGSLFC